jgi:hypothetical protein
LSDRIGLLLCRWACCSLIGHTQNNALGIPPRYLASGHYPLPPYLDLHAVVTRRYDRHIGNPRSRILLAKGLCHGQPGIKDVRGEGIILIVDIENLRLALTLSFQDYIHPLRSWAEAHIGDLDGGLGLGHRSLGHRHN